MIIFNSVKFKVLQGINIALRYLTMISLGVNDGSPVYEDHI